MPSSACLLRHEPAGRHEFLTLNILKMKKIYLYLIGIGAALLCMQCDKIEEPFMEVPEQKVAADTPYFEVQTQFIQKYLLEDYTGHTCLNCAKAHKIMHEMQAEMGDTLVCMAVHCLSFAKPEDAPYTADYRTPLGDYLAQHYSISGLPKGMINRREFDGNRVLNHTDWKAKMASIARTPAEIGIQIKDTSVATRPDSAYIFVKISYLKETSRSLRLHIVLLEDSVVSAQKQPDLSIDTHYVHQHVLRTNLSPLEGSVLSTGQSAAGSTDIRAYAIWRNPAWQWRHCQIAAFVMDAETEEVLQVENYRLR